MDGHCYCSVALGTDVRSGTLICLGQNAIIVIVVIFLIQG